MTSALVPFPSPTTTPRQGVPNPSHEPPAIHAICLDIDDTLIDFTGSARMALSILIGRDDMWPAWQRITDEHSAMVVSGELDYDSMRRARTKAFLADLGALIDDETVAVLEDRRLAQMSQAWRLFPDAVPCLDWLRAAGFKIAAVTNASGPHQRTRLAGLGLSRFFDAVISAGELGAAKPDPTIFHTACAELGVTPHETAHVGDRLDLDAIGARDAGLHGIWLDRAADQHDHDDTPEVPVVETLADLPELLVSEYRTPGMTSASGVPGPRR
ncbi:HAD family hydrolase [Actinokineospora iranica]|uniref:Putative hydrolase of the HAD superfamily n=1 Tax=Actinokineospora iranica TaxID=1271860 RepID=A0A1G6N779_9PSEU|nr:HAD family hydrolase [Actinokineospora iranica]SDC62985.1 putative hydrolase of the HAD superfamily [Actinokineospora iranica]